MSEDDLYNVVDEFFTDDDIRRLIDCIRREETNCDDPFVSYADALYSTGDGRVPLFTAEGVRTESEIMQAFVKHMRPLVTRYQLDWQQIKQVFFQRLDRMIHRPPDNPCAE